ncbi:hypothetical protein Sjap_009052 [Stephania japonica]|uniref:Uncharacterized protein n=1 Tax=Stephania japonica TaxID=461633 RepID=A0AAP0PBE9_9MAGN
MSLHQEAKTQFSYYWECISLFEFFSCGHYSFKTFCYLCWCVGAPAMTSRGALKFERSTASSRKTSNKGLVNKKDIEDLKAAVEKFSLSFDMPGFLMSEMKYKD